jgi:hypothetical protein
MRTPVRAIPVTVERWVSRARWLRWLDAVVAVALLWPLMAVVLEVAAVPSGVATLTLVGALAFIRPLRLRWRPASALVALAVSRQLRPGDVAWCVFPGRVERAIVTARRGCRLVVARPDQGPSEGLELRRTRVLVIEATEARPRE